VIDDSSSYQVLPIDGWEYVSPDCQACPVAVDATSWGKIKVLFR
jgi:hypothetical protein